MHQNMLVESQPLKTPCVGLRVLQRQEGGKAGRVQTAKPPTGNISYIYLRDSSRLILAKPKQNIDKLREGYSILSAQSHVCLFVYYAGG